MGKERTAGEPHRGHLHQRAVEHGVGPEISGPARTRDQVSGRGDRPQGRSALSRQQDDHDDRPVDRHLRVDGRALFGRDQGRADRRHRVFELRRLLRQRNEERRLRHDHLRGPVAEPGLSPAGERRRPADRCRRVLGQVGLGYRGGAQGQASGPADPCRLHRRRRREGRQVRLRGERHAPGGRAFRRRHGNGVEEPQGGRDPRHPRGLGRRCRRLHADDRGGQADPRGQRRHRPGPAGLWHPGADERHQRGRRAAHPQTTGMCSSTAPRTSRPRRWPSRVPMASPIW